MPEEKAPGQVLEKQEAQPVVAPVAAPASPASAAPQAKKASTPIEPAGNPNQRPSAMPVGNPILLPKKAPLPVNCAKCGSRMQREPGALPFSKGPYKGGFLCSDCWILSWDENPNVIGDAQTRNWVAQKAREVRLTRVGSGSEMLFEDGKTRAYLTARGTILVDLERLPFGGPDEFDPDRYQTMMKIFDAVRKTVTGYEAPVPGTVVRDEPGTPALLCGKCRGPISMAVAKGKVSATCQLCHVAISL